MFIGDRGGGVGKDAIEEKRVRKEVGGVGSDGRRTNRMVVAVDTGVNGKKRYIDRKNQLEVLEMADGVSVHIYTADVDHYGTVCILDGSQHLVTRELPFRGQVPESAAFLVYVFDKSTRSIIYAKHFWEVTAQMDRYVNIVLLDGEHSADSQLRDEWEQLSGLVDRVDEKEGRWTEPISVTLDLELPRPFYYYSQLPEEYYTPDQRQLNYWQGALEAVCWLNNVTVMQFANSGLKYIELLGDCVAHHVWATPYSKDRPEIDIGLPGRLCLDWRVRGGDCEDRSKDIVCAFEELRLMKPDDRMPAHLLHLYSLAQQYSAVYVERVNKRTGRCHVYVQLIPFEKVLGRTTNMPTLFVESNHQSYTDPRPGRRIYTTFDLMIAKRFSKKPTLSLKSVAVDNTDLNVDHHYYCHRLYLQTGCQLLVPSIPLRMQTSILSNSLIANRITSYPDFQRLLAVSNRLLPSIPPLSTTVKVDTVDVRCGWSAYQYVEVDRPVPDGQVVDVEGWTEGLVQVCKIPITNEYSALVAFCGRIKDDINKDSS